jgi:exopolysaccharide biosynthesis protein
MMRPLTSFLWFLLAPLLGFVLALYLTLGGEELLLPLGQVEPVLMSVEEKLASIGSSVGFIGVSLEEQQALYEEQKRVLRELAAKSQEQKELSDEVYEERILAKLGPPIRTHSSSNVEIKVFELKEIGYRGYIAKIKLFNPSSLRVVLGQDSWGKTETTSSAAARSGAILGVNGGGFYRSSRDGKEHVIPLGNTVVDGRLIKSFTPSSNGLFFAGVDTRGKLIGGLYGEKEQLLRENPWQGVSFVPILIRERMPLDIPREWANQRHPRTIIGEYANGDLVFIVVDGRQANWSSGVSLEEMQIKLLELGVIEAYNLDGGGSSTMVFAGEVLNRPSDGRERPVATNIVITPLPILTLVV